MATTRDALQAALAQQDPEALRLILAASEVDDRGAQTAPELAARIADAIWWNYATPIGYLAERATFEDVVRHLARRLKVDHRVDPDLPVWDQVDALTRVLVEEVPADGITVASLDEATRKRLSPSWIPSVGMGTGAAGSFATRWGTGHLLNLLRTPIGRLLPLLPGIGPWVGAIRTGAGALYVVSGPLGVALTVLSVNSALGTNYRRLVPLVLGVGALRPSPVEEAVEVEPVASEGAPA